jgi:IS5 family transposase
MLPAVPGLRDRARARPEKLHADKGYDFTRCRRHLRQRGIEPRIARRSVESHDRLEHLKVVRTHSWLAACGELRTRFERRLDTRLALLILARAVICSRFVQTVLLAAR